MDLVVRGEKNSQGTQGFSTLILDFKRVGLKTGIGGEKTAMEDDFPVGEGFYIGVFKTNDEFHDAIAVDVQHLCKDWLGLIGWLRLRLIFFTT